MIQKPYCKVDPLTEKSTIFWLPVRYKNVLEELKNRFRRPYNLWDDLDDIADYDEERTMALDRFLTALSAAGKSLTKLQLPIERLDVVEFCVYTARVTLLKLLQRVEQPTLSIFVSRAHVLFCRDARTVYQISKLIFPHLHHLTLDVGWLTSAHDSDPIDSDLMPQITHITLRSNKVFSLCEVGNNIYTILGLMDNCKATLKRLSILNLVQGPWIEFLEECEVEGLEQLDIAIESAAIDSDRTVGCLVPDEAQIFHAATEVRLSTGYYNALDREWERIAREEAEFDNDEDDENSCDEIVSSKKAAIGRGCYRSGASWMLWSDEEKEE